MRNSNFILNTFQKSRSAICVEGNSPRVLHWWSPYALVFQLIGPNIELSDRTVFKAKAIQMSGRSDLDQFKLFYSLFRGCEWRSLCHPQINGSLFFCLFNSTGTVHHISWCDAKNSPSRKWQSKQRSSPPSKVFVVEGSRDNCRRFSKNVTSRRPFMDKMAKMRTTLNSFHRWLIHHRNHRAPSPVQIGAICVFKSFLIVSLPIEIDTCPPVQLDCISMSTDASRTKKMMRSSSLDF